jgi:ABC-2 type transport system permease protein
MTGAGAVFDIGYQRYTGAREGLRRSRRALFKDSLRAALGFGRPARAKVLPWFFLGALVFIAVIMALVAGAAERLDGPGAAERLNLPSHVDYYGIASIVMFVFAAVVAPELLCRDKREGTINLYLVRPITGGDYVVQRWLAFFVVMTVAAWLPQLVLFMGLCGGDPDPLRYLQAHWVDIPRFLLSGAVMAAFLTTLALLTASFTSRRAYASIFLVGLVAIMTPFTVGVAEAIGGEPARWISLFTITNIPLHVNDVIFGELSELTEDIAAATQPAWIKVTWCTLWTVLPGAWLWSRYRRLTP